MGLYECKSSGQIDIKIHAETGGGLRDEYTTATLQADGEQIALTIEERETHVFRSGNQSSSRFTIGVNVLLNLIEKNGKKV